MNNKVIVNGVDVIKLLELYEKLADYRLLVIHKLLDNINDLEGEFDEGLDDMIDVIMVEVKEYGNEDSKIIEEIAKIRLELENNEK